ncbi:glycosyltransferase family 39 protein [Solirubrobacter taibaiensis]|nr:glycosyltransferase family 39 protein [Solirubrobacter taibaiensis]
MSAQPITRAGARQISFAALRRAELLAPAAVAVGFAVLVALTWGAWGDLGHDTGYDWVAAQRLADGELPYADFPYIYGPLGVGLLGGAFTVFGTGTTAVVALGIVLATAAVAITYRLGLVLAGPVGAALAAGSTVVAAVATGNMGLISPHAVGATTAIVLVLACVLAGARYAASGKRAWLALAGVTTGLGMLTRPEFAVALVLAPALWLMLRWLRAEGADRRRAVRAGATWAGVAVAIPLVVYGLLATQASPSALLENMFPSAQLAAGSDQILKASAPMTPASFARLAADLALYAVLAGAMLGAGLLVARGGKLRALVIAGAILGGVAFVGALLVNPEAIRSRLEYAYAWVPAGAALAALALTWRARSRTVEFSVRDQAALLLSVALTVIAAKTYAAFAPHPNPRFSQFAVYALPLAALFMAWLHLEVLGSRGVAVRRLGIAWLSALVAAGAVLVVNDARAETFTVSGPGGSITATPSDGPAYQAVLDAIAERTRPGDPVLLAPQMSALYTLADREDPLPAISLLPGMVPDEAAEERVIAQLRDVNLVVTDRRRLTEYGQGAFGVTYNRRLGAWLRSDFRRVATLRGAGDGAVTLDLWQRRATP